MQELQAVVTEKWQIQSNFEEVEKQLAEELKVYKGLIVTEDTLKQTKKDLADLRKKRAAIEDARKAVKKQWELPYEEFAAKCANLTGLFDMVIDSMSKQLNAFELERVLKKNEHLQELYKENIGEYGEYISFDQVYKKQWDNVSYKDSDVVYDISEAITKVRSDIDVIKSLSSEIEQDVLDTYKSSGNDLSAAIKRNQQYLTDKAKVEAVAKTESDSKISKEEIKPKAESMGELNNIVKAFKTVKFIISKEDEEEVENLLNLSDIKYQKVEG